MVVDQAIVSWGMRWVKPQSGSPLLKFMLLELQIWWPQWQSSPAVGWRW